MSETSAFITVIIVMIPIIVKYKIEVYWDAYHIIRFSRTPNFQNPVQNDR